MSADKDKPGKTLGGGASQGPGKSAGSAPNQGAGKQSGRAPGGQGAGARKPVTIDLKAESAPAKPSEKTAAKPQDSKTSDAKTAAQAPKAAQTGASSGATSAAASSVKQAGAATTAAAKGAGEKRAGEQKSAEKTTATASAREQASQSGPAHSSASSASVAGASTARRSSEGAAQENHSGPGVATMLLAGIVTSGVILAGAYGLHHAGYLPLRSEASDGEVQAALEASKTRIATLESRLADLAESTAAPVTGTADGIIDELKARVSALEKTPPAAQTTSASGETIDSLHEGLTELRRFVSSGGAGDQAALKSLEQAQTALNAEQSSISSKLEELEANAAKAADTQKVDEEMTSLKTELEKLSAGIDANKSELKAMGERLSAALAKVDEAQTRMTNIEASLATGASTRTAMQATLTSLSSQLSSSSDATSEALARLQADSEALAKRLAPVERSLGDVSARELAARALSVSSLKAAVDEGRPFKTELAAVEASAPQGTDFSALKQFQLTGLPSRERLISAFPAIARAMSATLDRPANDDLTETFMSGVRSLVSIRQPGESDADTPQAALGRLEARVEAGNLAGAMDAYAALPEKTQEAGADWAHKVQARLDADALVARITNEVLNQIAQERN